MVNNSINIIKTKESLNIKTKESLNSDGQQFHQYHQNKRKFKHQNKKESLNSDGQQFHQYHQNKRKFKQWWSTIPSISPKQKKV